MKTQKKTSQDAPLNAAEISVGVVGIGLMGAVMTACMLAGGHPVAAIALEETERKTAQRRVKKHLQFMADSGALHEDLKPVLARLKVSGEYSRLADCELVVESIIEDLEAKREVVRRVEEHVSSRAIIGSNTSGLPISLIAQNAKKPERIIGLHWLSSSPLGVGVEIMGGKKTAPRFKKRAAEIVKLWGKTPTNVAQDVKGFIGNRIFYVMLREAFALVDSGAATPEDVDLALASSGGNWLPYGGLFRYLDLSGLAAYPNVIRDMFPDLHNENEVPKSLEKLVKSGARGVENGRGFYSYTPAQAKAWQEEFQNFRRDVIALQQQYEKKLKAK
jgi:3-hydroxybutyryl-CoA dehydrogenase